MQSIIEGFSNLWEFGKEIVNSIVNSTQAIGVLYDKIVEFSGTMDQLIVDASTGSINSLPIYQCIGMVRYMVGDAAFYLFYVVILFGCAMTVYKLVVLIYKCFKGLSGDTSTSISSIISKLK